MSARIGAAVAFFSGFVALGYEILWARRLSDIVGATSFSSSLVVGTFFLALAAGAARFGPIASRHASPWKLYAWLELGILVTVVPAFAGERLSGALLAAFGPALMQPVVGLIGKTALAVVFVAPASFLMGGTLPALGQAVVQSDRLGREGNVIYGLNTLGGALGIVFATFFLIPSLGMRAAFVTLMAGSLALALFALSQARRGGANATTAAASPRAASRAAHTERHADRAFPSARYSWLWLAGISGFAVLGLEILALHLFSQVLHNSGYTFATVLVIVITTLAVGPLVTQAWRLDAATAWRRAALVLLLAACATAALPRLFFEVTDGLAPFGGGSVGLDAYIARIVGVGALVLGPVFVLSGWVFPLVLSGVGMLPGGVGERWGRLLGVNAAGAMLGLLLANHVAMPHLGLWWSIAAWGVVLLAAGLVVARRVAGGRTPLFVLATICVLVFVVGNPGSLPVAHLTDGEAVVATSSGADGVAAVIERAQMGDRRIKWNNTYSLGGTSNRAQQARLGFIPLLLHPEPRSAAFIGLATGITASSALHDPGITQVTSVELSAQIANLACAHFSETNAQVCTEPRSRVVVEDGRMFFRATRDQYDVVVGDLFVPWRSGVATLFTREHFESVRTRLRAGGLFAQWLPLFQLDAQGFWGIATTFAEVFPNAWLAIADFQPYSAGVVLIGWKETADGPRWDVLAARCRGLGARPVLREPMLATPDAAAMFLVGPVRPALPANMPIMTLDDPWLGDHAPRVQRGAGRFLQGPELVHTLQSIASHVPAGPFREPTRLGVQLFEFCERAERESGQAAVAWYESNVTTPLPRAFLVPRAERLNWPFTEQTGRFLIAKARQQARARSAPRSP